jgi:hypothetical protein
MARSPFRTWNSLVDCCISTSSANTMMLENEPSWARRTISPPSTGNKQKGSATSDKVPPHLLRLFGLHQRLHRYVPRHDYIPGGSNTLADDASHLHCEHTYPQPLSYHYAMPMPSLISAVILALLKKPYNVESLRGETPDPTPTGNPGAVSQLSWASTPFSKPSKTRYQSYKSSSSEFDLEHLQSNAIPSSLERLKITYGALAKRSPCWATQIHTWTK